MTLSRSPPAPPITAIDKVEYRLGLRVSWGLGLGAFGVRAEGCPENGEPRFQAAAARRVSGARTRLQTGSEGWLALGCRACDVGLAHARGGGLRVPGWSSGPLRPTHSLKLSTAPAFISSVLRRENAVTRPSPTLSGPTSPASSPPNYPKSRISPIIFTAEAFDRTGSGSLGRAGRGTRDDQL